MIPSATVRMKCLLPGYRARWRAGASVLLREMAALCQDARFGWEGDDPTVTLADGTSIAGMVSTRKDLELRYLLGDAVPAGIDAAHFRLARDLVTRYRYPHLRPDLSPRDATESVHGTLVGFHGQHKDTIQDIADSARRALYREAFTPKPNDVILDCGAFLGLGELSLAPALTEGHVVALEANPDCHRLLARNIQTNQISNVRVRHGAIWRDHGGVMDLATGEAQANTLLPALYDGGGRVTVETASVDGLIEEMALDRLTMLSLTVNGAEIEALHGAARCLTDSRPRIRLAGWYEREGRPIAAHCAEILESLDYDVHIGPRLGVLAIPKEQMS